MPPGSKPVPAGRRTSRPSTSMSVQPEQQRAAAGRRARTDVVERPVVAGADDVTQHGGIEAPAREPPRLDGPLDEQHGLLRHRDRRPRAPGELGDLAVGKEAAPPPLEIVDSATRPLDESRDSPHYDHVGIAAHGSEAKLSCHGSTS